MKHQLKKPIFLAACLVFFSTNLSAQIDATRLFVKNDSTVRVFFDAISYNGLTLFASSRGFYYVHESELVLHESAKKFERDQGPAAAVVFKNTLYASVIEEGIFSFDEKAKKWNLVTKGLADSIFWELRVCGDYLFAVSDNNGVYRSIDGKTWENLEQTHSHSANVDVGEGAFFRRVSKLFVFDKILYSVTASSAIAQSSDYGITWTWLTESLKSGEINGLHKSGTDIYYSLYNGNANTGIYKKDSAKGSAPVQIGKKFQSNHFLRLYSGDGSTLYYYLIDLDINKKKGTIRSVNTKTMLDDRIVADARPTFMKKIGDTWYIGQKDGYIIAIKDSEK